MQPKSFVRGEYTLEDTGRQPQAVYVPILKVQVIRDTRLFTGYRTVTCPRDAATVALDLLRGADREHAISLLLDTMNHIIGVHRVSVGTLDATFINPREVYKPALILGAVGIILIHNHPSNDPTPSERDLVATSILIASGKILGVTLLDHIIVTDDDWTSIRESQILEWKE